MNVEHGNIMKVGPEHQMNHVNKGRQGRVSDDFPYPLNQFCLANSA